LLKDSDKRMSALARQFEPVPQKLENVRFSAGRPLENAEVKGAIAEAEQRLNGSGRLLVRASGTEPLIRIMAEGDDEKLVNQVVKEIAGAVKKAAA
jgi:phosphoglucosamine mutase